MIAINWTALGLGMGIGVCSSAAFFAGLGFGMQLALKTGRTVSLLALSAVIRIGLLLAIGWAVVSWAGPFALAGYGLAFFLIRTAVTTIARTELRAGPAP